MQKKKNKFLGRFNLITGVFFLMLLLTLTVRGYQIVPEEIERGPRNLPPKPLFLQFLLSSDKSQVQDWKERHDMDSFFTFDWENEESGSETDTEISIPEITSRPGIRAVAGKKYRYRIAYRKEYKDPTGDNAVVCKLQDGPENATIRDCLLEWKPLEESGVVPITVLVYESGTGQGQRQDFEVVVTESLFYLGTDNRGRDFVSLIFLCMKWVLSSGLIVAFAALLVGLPLGAYGAFYDNRFSKIMKYTEQFIESLPFIILLFLVSLSTQFNIYAVMFVFGIFMAPTVSKIVYVLVHDMKNSYFIEASRELGVDDHRILWTEIIWYNGKGRLLIQVCNLFALAMLLEVMLSYLQLGVRLPEMSFGILLHQGNSQLLSGNLWLTVITTFIIIFVINIYYLLGSGIKISFER